MSAQFDIRSPGLAAVVPPIRDRRAPPPAVRTTLKTLRLELPQFPLEVALRGVAANEPCVLAHTGAPDARVAFANAPAARQGARVNLSLRMLSAFGPDIRRVTRQPAAEAQCREHLVRWLQALGCTVEVVADANGAVTLHAALASSRPDEFWRTRLRRDLRAFGLRAQLEFPAATATATAERGLPAVAMSRSSGFVSRIDLPWPVVHAHELTPAASRLLDELRVIHEAEQRPIRWLQWTFCDSAGARHHHVFEVDTTLPPMARLGAWTRERLHRMVDTSPWRGVALKAALG